MNPPKDLGAFIDTPVDQAALKRAMAGGLRRYRRHQLLVRLLTAGAITVGAATAVVFGVRMGTSPQGSSIDAAAASGSVRELTKSVRPRDLLGALSTGAVMPALMTARSADEFADSIGLHVRLNYGAYQVAKPLVRERLQSLGVRHLFDVARTNYSELRALGDLGFRIHVLVQEGSDPLTIAGRLGDTLASLQADWRLDEHKGGPSLDAVWADRTRKSARSLMAVAKSSAALAQVTVLGPSIRFPFETKLVGDLGEAADVGALNYWSAPGAPGGRWLDEELAGQRVVYPSQGLVITQGGYSTAALHLRHVSDAVQAKYLLRLHGEAFSRGVLRTFANQLMDFSADPESLDSGLGVIHTDGREKPAFHALRQVIAATADQGAAFVPAPLGLAIESGPADMRTVLLGKRDGSYLLLAWLGRDSGDGDVRAPAVLRLAAKIRSFTVRELAVVSPPESVTGQGSDRIELQVSDGLTLVELRP